VSERREPVLGDLGKLGAPASAPGAEPHATAEDFASAYASVEHRRSEPSPRARWPWLAGGALLVAIVAALLLWRGPIGNRLVPVPRETLLMRDAERALAHGNLTSPDGRGASELYAAVLALDPDRQPAREGLKRVGEAALVQARDALQRNDTARARIDLALAHRLSVPVAEITPLDEALLRHATAGTSIANLLDRAAAAERAGHLDEGQGGDQGEGALALYQRALAADPGNAVAIARRQALFAQLLDRAGARADAGDVDAASAIIERVAAIDAANPDLPVARAQLAAARERREHGQEHTLENADAALRSGRIDAAVAGYRSVIAGESGNPRARAGLRAAADAYASQAGRQASEFAFARADALLVQAKALAPDAPSIHVAEQHIRVARARHGGATTVHTQADKDRVPRLLADAQRAIDSDNLLDPPGDSAFDKLRAAAAIAPDDPGVRATQRRFGPAAIACFERAMVGNQLGRAEGCMDALTMVQPGYQKLSSMREALAQRWLAVADERLGAGEFIAVRKALDAARRLSPRLRGLPALETRLEQARAGGGR
jgi:tetratricopeptide (TPR) repeat protein